MMKREDIYKFYLTKEHSIEYSQHMYFKSIINKHIIEDKKIREEYWIIKSIRLYIFKNYFEE